MPRTILVTGSTDGIGLETARLLHADGHNVILHGRSLDKLEAARRAIEATPTGGRIETVVADFSRLSGAETLAKAISERREPIDVLINNAGVLKTPKPVTPEGLDVRFVVNTIAPFLLTTRLLPHLNDGARVINLSSAAQETVDLEALAGRHRLSDMSAYAQSKLALTMWSRLVASSTDASGKTVIAVNPGSLLASKMVRDGFGVPGKDLRIGADILTRLALDETYATASGQYFDNDAGRFASPHPDALDDQKCGAVIWHIQRLIAEHSTTAAH